MAQGLLKIINPDCRYHLVANGLKSWPIEDRSGCAGYPPGGLVQKNKMAVRFFIVRGVGVVLAIVRIAWFIRVLKNDCASVDPGTRGAIRSGKNKHRHVGIHTGPRGHEVGGEEPINYVRSAYSPYGSHHLSGQNL